MRKRPPAAARLAAGLAGLAALAACAPDRAPTEPTARRALPLFAGDPFTGDSTELLVLVDYLFVEDKAKALAEARLIVNSVPNRPASCGNTALLLDRTFTNYRQLKLYGQFTDGVPDLTFPRPLVQKLVQRLWFNCAALAPRAGVPDAVLDVGGAAGVIRAGEGGEVVTIPGPDGQAGVRVPPGTFDEDVVLYIVPKPPARLLPTTLPQYPPYYDIFVLPTQPTPYRFLLDLGFVVNWPDRPPSDHLVIGHEVTPGVMEVLQPIVLTTPPSGRGQWGGPAYMRPASVPALRLTPGSAPAAAGAVSLAVTRGTTISYGGQAGSLSPFGLVSIFQSGVSPSAAVTFGQSVCVGGRPTLPYTVNTASDIVFNYQELSGRGGAIGPRRLLYIAGRGTGAPRPETFTASSGGVARIRFYFGSTLFTTRTLANCPPE